MTLRVSLTLRSLSDMFDLCTEHSSIYRNVTQPAEPVMLGNFGRPDPLSLSHADRIREAVRANFELGTEIVIMVSELECQAPGCPPLETVVAFWTDEGRHRFKVFKPMSEFDDEDLPWKWLRRSLTVPEGYVDGCC